jgi:hypothetical protein
VYAVFTRTGTWTGTRDSGIARRGGPVVGPIRLRWLLGVLGAAFLAVKYL